MSHLSCSSADFATLGAAILGAGNSLRFQASGGSMQPLLRDGDTLTVVPVDPRQIRLGDVLLFANDQGRALAHRVIQVHRGGAELAFTLRGDQAFSPDGRIPQGQVLGRVVEIEREGEIIRTNSFSMRLLGSLVVIRARGRLGEMRGFRLARNLLRYFPMFYRYII